jgi:hypothetical protein
MTREILSVVLVAELIIGCTASICAAGEPHMKAATAQSGEVPKLSPAEMTAIYKAAGLTERGGKVIDACGKPVEPKVDVVDLNGDGQPEVFVQVMDSMCYGMAGGELFLFIKDKHGHWRSNLGFSAGGYKLLSTKNKGYPDIEIGGPGFCFPVWRWNGRAYAIHKRCAP